MLHEVSELIAHVSGYAFHLSDAPPAVAVSHWSHLPHRTQVRSCGRHARGFVVRFGDVQFHLDTIARTIVCSAPSRTGPETIRFYALEQMLPMLLGTLGRDVVHAAAVAGPHGVVAFVGPSRAGKSTLAAAVALRPDHAFVSDEALLLEERPGAGWHGRGLHGGTWLQGDAVDALALRDRSATRVSDGRAKVPITLERRAGGGRISRIYLLARGDGAGPVETAETPHAEAAERLARACFWLAPPAPSARAAQLGRLARLAAAVPVMTLRVPDGLGRLREVERHITGDPT